MSCTNCHHVNTEFNDNYCYVFKLFLSINHANQILYLDVKFASLKHYFCLFFGSFRIHDANNDYVYLKFTGQLSSIKCYVYYRGSFYYFVFTILREIFNYYFSSALPKLCSQAICCIFVWHDCAFFDIPVVNLSCQFFKGAPSTCVHCGRALHRKHLLSCNTEIKKIYYGILIVFENCIFST